MTDARPLFNYEAEQAVIAALLANNGTYPTLVGAVRPEDFYDPLHGRIFEAACKLIECGERATFLTLKDHFDRDPALQHAGGDRYLARLENAVVTINDCDDYARVVRDLAERRRLVAACERAMADANDVTLDRPGAAVAAALVNEIQTDISAADDGLVTIAEVAESVVEGLGKEFPCYETGLPTLDAAICGGLFEHKFYGIAGEDKAGKSLLMATIAHNLNMAGVPTLYLSLEMGPQEQAQRILARMMNTNSLAFLDRSRRGSADFQHAAAEAAVELRTHNGLILMRRPRMTLDEVKIAIAKAAVGRGVRGVFVDYLQLVTGQRRGETLAAHYDNVAQALAEMTQRYSIFIVAAAQLNREGTVRQGDGLLKACDMTLKLHKVEMAGAPDQAWLDMWRTRFTPKMNLGSDREPALELCAKAGPHFREVSP